MENLITKHVVEIRYEPNPNFLDKKGMITTVISPQIFKHWRISQNKIEFFNPDDNINAFFTYKNLGLSTIYPETTEKFISVSRDLIKESWNFFSTNKIQRVGIRSGFLCPKEVSFKRLFNSFNKNFVNQSFIEDKSIFGDAKLVDVGLNLNFSVDSEFFNIMTGAMEKKQIEDFFPNVENLPEQGIYLEIDYFKNEFRPVIKQKEIFNLIEKGVKQGKSVFENIFRLIDNHV